MQILRKVTNVSRQDRVPNEEVCQRCNIQEIADWMLCRRNEWNDHISRITEDGLAKNYKQQGRPMKDEQNHWYDGKAEGSRSKTRFTFL